MLSHTHLHDAEELLLVFYGLCHVISIHVCEHVGGEEIPVCTHRRQRSLIPSTPSLVTYVATTRTSWGNLSLGCVLNRISYSLIIEHYTTDREVVLLILQLEWWLTIEH